MFVISSILDCNHTTRLAYCFGLRRRAQCSRFRVEFEHLLRLHRGRCLSSWGCSEGLWRFDIARGLLRSITWLLRGGFDEGRFREARSQLAAPNASSNFIALLWLVEMTQDSSIERLLCTLPSPASFLALGIILGERGVCLPPLSLGTFGGSWRSFVGCWRSGIYRQRRRRNSRLVDVSLGEERMKLLGGFAIFSLHHCRDQDRSH